MNWHQNCRFWFIVLLAGCGNHDSRIDFVTKADKLTTEFAEKGEQLGATMKPWFEGEVLDVERAERQIEEIRIVLSRTFDQFETMQVPRDGNDLAKIHRQYLEFQSDVLGSMEQCVQVASMDNPGSNENREKFLRQFSDLNQREVRFKELISAESFKFLQASALGSGLDL